MNKYRVKKFYPKVVFIQEAEGNPSEILKVIMTEGRTGLYAISFEPKSVRGHMQALERTPMHYLGGEVVSLAEAIKIPECTSVIQRIDRNQNTALVKCRDGHYAPLYAGDTVFDAKMKKIWPQDKEHSATRSKISTPVLHRSAERG